MSRLVNRLFPWMLTLLLGVIVLLFWWRAYPFALSYHEQFQLFLFEDDYLVNRIIEPGGVARYVSEFLVQFYNNVLFGAIVIALLLMLMQRLTWRIIVSTITSAEVGKRRTQIFYLLSFMPSLVVWYMMGDENLLLAFVVALIMIQAAMLVCSRLSFWWQLVLLPVMYWVAGPLVMLLALYVTAMALVRHRYMLSPLPVLLVIVCVILSSLVRPYPLSVLWCGLGYYRYVSTLPSLKGFDDRTYELIEYDYLVRTQRWDKVIAKAETKTPDLPMSVCATNLALAMKGQLLDRAFEFYQRGSQGLLPPFERNYTSTLTTGEAYFYLGLVNTSQRFAFESMEAIPNYNKSARVVRRLAETNLINGDYAVARKYLKMLRKTLFYRKWAMRTEALLGNESAINAHPLYGYLRRARIKEDFLYSDRELDKICGQLVVANKENQVAVQYLLMFPVLDADVTRFMNYMTFVSQLQPGYMPRICQEMVTFAYASRRQQPPRGTVPDAMLQQFNQFMQSGNREAFRHTTWYYLSKKE